MILSEILFPISQEFQEVEIHIDEEETSVDSADEVAGSTTSNDSNEFENTEAIAKVHAYMNHALMNDDSDSDRRHPARHAFANPNRWRFVEGFHGTPGWEL